MQRTGVVRNAPKSGTRRLNCVALNVATSMMPVRVTVTSSWGPTLPSRSVPLPVSFTVIMPTVLPSAMPSSYASCAFCFPIIDARTTVSGREENTAVRAVSATSANRATSNSTSVGRSEMFLYVTTYLSSAHVPKTFSPTSHARTDIALVVRQREHMSYWHGRQWPTADGLFFSGMALLHKSHFQPL